MFINENYSYVDNNTDIQVQPTYVQLPYVACVDCYAIYSSNSSTTVLKKHSCVQQLQSKSIPETETKTSTNIYKKYSYSKFVKVTTKENKLAKEGSMPPIKYV